MSRIIRLIDNETIEISDYRNSGYLFDHNAPTIEDIRKQISNIDDWCAFKETINPFVLYGEKEKLQHKIDKAIKYIKEWCIDDEFYVNLTKKEKCIFDVLSILEGKEVEDE